MIKWKAVWSDELVQVSIKDSYGKADNLIKLTARTTLRYQKIKPYLKEHD